MIGQLDLLGYPPPDPALSQWMTPMWLARRLAEWVPTDARVLEPSAGSGNLVRGLLGQGHLPNLIVACEADARWLPMLSDLEIGHVLIGNFLETALPAFDAVIMNPPFENNLHARFIECALELAPLVVGIFPASIEFSQERDRLWREKAIVTHRARCPARVDYGGSQSPSFDTVALAIERRSCARFPDEVMPVFEEIWEAP